jgi:hypothetical protein
MKQRGDSTPPKAPVILHLYVSTNRDGLLICPEHTKGGLGPDGRRRIFIGCEYTADQHDMKKRLADMDDGQIRALIDLAFRRPGVHKTAVKAKFFDAQIWAESWDNRRKLVHEVALP